jgi:hypothetical protein
MSFCSGERECLYLAGGAREFDVQEHARSRPRVTLLRRQPSGVLVSPMRTLVLRGLYRC